MSEDSPGEKPSTLGDKFIQWARQAPSVHALVQIGSQVRGSGEAGAADALSDWDFQVVSSEPALLENRVTYEQIAGAPLALAARGGRLGSARKVSLVFPDGELDIVVIPLTQYGGVAQQVAAGEHAKNPPVWRALEDLTLVLLGGYRVLKGGPDVKALFRFVAQSVPAPRLNDTAVRQLAEGFVCDYVSTHRKLSRGEWLAAQRWLHHQLAETNLQLAHELRQRAGQVSFPDARRIESLYDAELQAALAVSALPDKASLRAAVEKSAETCRFLAHALLGDAWRWPAGLPAAAS